MTTDEALARAESAMACRAPYTDTLVPVAVLRRLVDYVKAVRPVQDVAPDDFNRWQDAIDAALNGPGR